VEDQQWDNIMGLTSANISSFFTNLLQKGDPLAAMTAGKGPVTAEWAKTHGYKQFRTPDIAVTKEVTKLAGEATSLYGTYAKDKAAKKRIKAVKKETKKKKLLAEERRVKSKILRRPSRERGIL
jgi:hypothetical protein